MFVFNDTSERFTRAAFLVQDFQSKNKTEGTFNQANRGKKLTPILQFYNVKASSISAPHGCSSKARTQRGRP